MADSDFQKLAHELALEYVRRTSELSPKSRAVAYADVYLDAFDAILSELEKQFEKPSN